MLPGYRQLYIQTVQRLRTFTQILLQKMLKQDLVLQFMNQTDHCGNGKLRKVTGLINGELGAEILGEFAALGPKRYSYLTDENEENKKAKDTKRSVIKWKFKFEFYKLCR